MADVRPSLAVLKSWRQVYQTYNLLKQCQDQICGEYGLTVEQYSVLVVLNYAGGSARVTDIAEWLVHSANSISMIVDRMVKVGLVKRTRDRVDRRVVWVTPASKGNAALKQAHLAVLKFVRKVFQPLSAEDENTFSGLLGTLKYEIMKYSNPELDIKEAKKIDSKQLDSIVKWMSGEQ
ncbi:MAG: MarR family winged helix-turn-helix transcriptional regulator, partial [Dehalococcoidia bacterium]|nr:MarR family winged helix-turn-helix transcriptional regulator [Dehalococcoidia bacterium]